MYQGVLEEAAKQTSLSRSLLALTIAATAGLIGLLSGWAGAYLKVKGQNLATKEDFREALRRVEENTRVVEERKAFVARRSSLDAELREAVRHFTTAAGGLLHSICWLTWDSDVRSRIDFEMARRYDAEAHALSPQIVAHLAIVAMINREVHAKCAPLAHAIFKLDAEVGNAVVRGETDLQRGVEELRACHAVGSRLERTFRDDITNLLKEDPHGPV